MGPRHRRASRVRQSGSLGPWQWQWLAAVSLPGPPWLLPPTVRMDESADSGAASVPSYPHPHLSSSSSSPASPRHGHGQQPSPSITYRVDISIPGAAETRDEACSCLVILLTFWFFASMTLILGLYGPVDLLLGPNTSMLLQANSFFVQDLQVRSDGVSRPGLILHSFHTLPPLDIEATWSETHNTSVPPNSHKEWSYFLNKGSHIQVSYSVGSQGSSPLTLAIIQGKDSLIQWTGDPSYPNTTLSWSLVNGNGVIHQSISRSYDYYIAVGNLNQLEMKVSLHFKIQALLYNTTGPHYKCSVFQRSCVLKLFFLGANDAILTTSGPEQAGSSDEWYVRLSYGPRWITYFIGSGVMTVAILLAFKICTDLQSNSGDNARQQIVESITDRAPLLPDKDDDDLSLGSSYDSISHDEEDPEVWHTAASNSLKVSEIDKSCHLCTICSDAQRDCFFLPCGHCATCLTCGISITGESGTCPICQRRMKKVRKIFTV